MPARERRPTPVELSAARRSRAWALRIARYTHSEIADRLEVEGFGRVSRQAVTLMLAKAEKDFRERHYADVEAEKFTQIAALEHHYREAMDQWERSKRDSTLSREKTFDEPVEDVEGEPDHKRPGSAIVASRKEYTQERRGQCGDPRYLAEARATLADIRKILGVEAQLRDDGWGGSGPMPIVQIIVESPSPSSLPSPMIDVECGPEPEPESGPYNGNGYGNGDHD